ncbi:MAG: hypothetical protein JWN25_1902 [Verrucomicrobiales bacterium]|nr:hypothetical protein [Verrucomicrobiales bacterium]
MRSRAASLQRCGPKRRRHSLSSNLETIRNSISRGAMVIVNEIFLIHLPQERHGPTPNHHRESRRKDQPQNRQQQIFSRGILLLGITQRSIRVSRRHISTERIPRKGFPKDVKTLGDQIRFKRLELNIPRVQAARALKVTARKFSRFERDMEIPTDAHMVVLQRLLQIRSDFHPATILEKSENSAVKAIQTGSQIEKVNPTATLLPLWHPI